MKPALRSARLGQPIAMNSEAKECARCPRHVRTICLFLVFALLQHLAVVQFDDAEAAGRAGIAVLWSIAGIWIAVGFLFGLILSEYREHRPRWVRLALVGCVVLALIATLIVVVVFLVHHSSE